MGLDMARHVPGRPLQEPIEGADARMAEAKPAMPPPPEPAEAL